MDKAQHREVTYESAINKELKDKNIYTKTNVLDVVSDDDVDINLEKKKIYIKSNMSYIAFMSYMYIKWHQEDSLSRLRIPLKLISTEIELSGGWKIIGKKKILLPSDVKKLHNTERSL